MAEAHLVQLLLPLYDNYGQALPKLQFDQVRTELTEAFGGVTAYARSPATGAWADDAGRVRRDEVILFEVMTATLDRAWWARYREMLEQRFAQDQIVVRALAISQL